jgi:pyridoxine/pyridoxamine 5'-phosphate oxidase
VVAGRRLQYERARVAELAAVRQHQYPLPSYFTDVGIAEDAQHRWQQLREARLHRRLETGNHGRDGGFDAGGSGAQ